MKYEQLSFIESNETHTPEKIKEQHYGAPKLLKVSRDQVEFKTSCLDDLISIDHPVRAVWDYVERLDLTIALNKIESCEGCSGRSAIDPKILIALWLFATIEGIGSARQLARYTNEHLAFKWICGNVGVERRTISDFRVNSGELFEDILAQGVAVLVHAGQVTLKEIAHDGLRVRADASKKSYRREETLKNEYLKAKERIAELKNEIENNPGKYSNREKANKTRIAEERKRKIEDAMKNLQEMLKEKNQNRIKNKKKKLTEEEKKEARASSSDPDTRKMKMPNGGFHLAYNFQFAAETEHTVIVGVDVVQAGTDSGQMLPMFKKITEQYQILPERYLVDGGYKNQFDVNEMTKQGCQIYMPVQEKSRGKSLENAHQAKPSESKEVGEWRERMGTEESKSIYKRRAMTIELVNARLRKCGLYRLFVRGLGKAKIVGHMFAVSHNLIRTIKLGLV